MSYIEQRPWYIKSQKRKKEERERLRGERDQIKFIGLRFERSQVARSRKAKRRQDVYKLHVLGMNTMVSVSG